MLIRSTKNTKRLGDILIDAGYLTQEQLGEALEKQKELGKLLGVVLVDLGFVTQEQIFDAIQEQLDIKPIQLSTIEIPRDALDAVKDVSVLKKASCIPFELHGNILNVAMSDPLNSHAIDDIQIASGYKVKPFITTLSDINIALDKYYGSEQMGELLDEVTSSLDIIDIDKEVDEKSSDAPLIKLVNEIFDQAVHMGSSDIHIEPLENRVRVRYRVDGDLVEQKSSFPVAIGPGIVSRIKIMGSMDIAEKRKPQDGRITIKVDGVEYDVRVSILPTSFGEKIVMRLTNKQRLTMEKKNLGLLPEDEVKFDSLLENSHGIILVTGPTGSGKSTTLYTALSELNKEKVNICTVEDPVEANIDGLNQVQVNAKAGLTFPAALRSFLRQDPDIIMVGEIRDLETASLAVDASLTGHLVVSTLHTNSSISSISRLEKMGIEPYLIADATVGILAQRLVKRLCDCKKEVKPTKIEKIKLGLPKDDDTTTIYKPCGCVKCNNTGYKGRIGVYEILIFTDRLKNAIADERPMSELEEIAREDGLCTLKDSCIKLIKKGITTVQEMDRIVHSPEIIEEDEV